MLNFEEELKNFKPMPEVKEMEKMIADRRNMDVTDIIADILHKQDKKTK